MPILKLRYKLAIFFLFCIVIPLSAHAADAKWYHWVIDGHNKLAGWGNSFGFDYQNRPILVYYDMDKACLVSAMYDHGSWHHTTIDAEVDSLPFPSVAFGDRGGGGVSYVFKTEPYSGIFGLKFSSFDGVKWGKPEFIDSHKYPKGSKLILALSSLAVDSRGRPGAAFPGADKGEARIAILDQEKWRHKIAHEKIGSRFSMAFDKNDYPAIVGASIGYLHYNGRTWDHHNLPIDMTKSGVWQVSLKFDHKNRAALAYNEYPADKLRYAVHDGKDWTVITIDEGLQVGIVLSLAFDPDGHPAIAYFDMRDHSLHYAFYDGMVWQTEKVDGPIGFSSPGPDYCTPITLDFDKNGNPGISYFDANNEQLMFAFKELKPVKNLFEICNNDKDDDGDGLIDGDDANCLQDVRISYTLKGLRTNRYQPHFTVNALDGTPVKGIRFKLGGASCAGSTNEDGKLICNYALDIPEQGLKWQAESKQGIIRESVLTLQEVNLSGLFKGTTGLISIYSEGDRYQVDPSTTHRLHLVDDFYRWEGVNSAGVPQSGFFVVENGKAKAVRFTFPVSVETKKTVTDGFFVGTYEKTDKKYKVGAVVDADTPLYEDALRLEKGKHHGVVVIEETKDGPKYIHDHEEAIQIFKLWKLNEEFRDPVGTPILNKRRKIVQKAMASFLKKYDEGKIINEHYWNFYCKIYFCSSDEEKNKEVAKETVNSAAWEIGQSAFVNGVAAAAVKSSSGLIFKEALNMHAMAFAKGVANGSLVDPVSLVVSLGAIVIGYGFKMGNFGHWRDAMKGFAKLAKTLAENAYPKKELNKWERPNHGDAYLATLEAARRHYQFAHKLYSFYRDHPAEKIPLFLSPDTDELVRTAQGNIDEVTGWINDYEKEFIEQHAIDTAFGIAWARLIKDKQAAEKRSHLSSIKPGLRKQSPISWEKLNYKRYRSSGKKSSYYTAIAGGCDTDGCKVVHMGVLPQNFPVSDVQVVTFLLTDSLEHLVLPKGHKDTIRHSSTALKLKLGDRESLAKSAKMPPGITGVEGPAWYVTFEFEPAARVWPGEKWYLKDGDNDANTVVVLHSGDQDYSGLLGFAETSGCAKSSARRTGYSVWFGMKKKE